MFGRLSLGIGLVLVVMGIGLYALANPPSITAAIPAFLGLPMALAGWALLSGRWQTPARWLVAALCAVGVFGSLRVFGQLGEALAGTSGNPLAISGQLAVIALCLVLLVVFAREQWLARRA